MSRTQSRTTGLQPGADAVRWNIGAMATQNNLHIPDDLLSAVSEAASADGKTTDELAAEALRRYLAHRNLEELGQYGREQSSRLGYTEAGVTRLSAESRRENRGR